MRTVDQLDDGSVLDDDPDRRQTSSGSNSLDAWAVMFSASESSRWCLSMASWMPALVATTVLDLGTGDGADVVDGEDVGRVGHGATNRRITWQLGPDGPSSQRMGRAW